MNTAIALAPQGSWGERVIAAFNQRWQELGGALAEHHYYDSAANDFSKLLQDILNLDESEARYKQMRSTLGKRVHFEPHIRDDADFIFVAGSPSLVRQIRPQLQFHHASGLTVYSTSSIYSGRPDPRADIDLEGIIFPDIPWLLLYEGEQDPLAREQLDELFPSAAANPRLYAMGADVYTLLTRAELLLGGGRLEVEGRTGILRNDGQNHILRQLVWAQFEQGIPKVLGYIKAPPSPVLEPAPSQQRRIPTIKQPAAREGGREPPFMPSLRVPRIEL
jgi:outer membrane PBP1 activator LpoA protein